MKAEAVQLLEFLDDARQFVIPVYQRRYDWQVKNCRQLWDDIVRIALDENKESHFLGSVVCVANDDTNRPEPIAERVVIDGQQRLTTVTLILTALRESLRETGGAIALLADEPLAPEALTVRFLTTGKTTYAGRTKLVLSQGDQDTLRQLVEGGVEPADVSFSIRRNYTKIREWLRSSDVPLQVFARGLAKLVIVEVTLDGAHDNPQQIFESLNNTGRDLAQSDLVRNYLLMGLDHQWQTKLYGQYWLPMERRLIATKQGKQESIFDRFLRDVLTMQTGTTPNINDVYEEFKTHVAGRLPGDVVSVLSELALAAKHYACIAANAEQDPELVRRFADLATLTVDVAYPLVLALYGHYAAGALAKADFVRLLDLIESYVFRRAVCQLPTNSLNKIFAQLARDIDTTAVADSVTARLMGLGDRRRFPNDEDVQRGFMTWNAYESGRAQYVLLKLENHRHKEVVRPGEYTIEHILPQNEQMPEEWREMLGPEWRRVWEARRHTLGNLTLTGYNSELSDRPFHEKRTMKGGFNDARFRLNEDVRLMEQWTEGEIVTRGVRLATLAVTEVWPAPVLDPSILALYREAGEEDVARDEDNGEPESDDVDGSDPAAKERILSEHHGHMQGRLRDIYEQLVERVGELGPDVRSPRIRKNYIAFQATRDFFDVKAQKARLRLRLRLNYAEVVDLDSAGICKDITGKWRDGTGVRIDLARPEDIDDAMVFVRQAYRNQAQSRET